MSAIVALVSSTTGQQTAAINKAPKGATTIATASARIAGARPLPHTPLLQKCHPATTSNHLPQNPSIITTANPLPLAH